MLLIGPLPSILPLTSRILRMYDGEIATLTAQGADLCRVSDGAPIEREREVFTGGMEAAAKGGYPHFMLKEIHEQPQVARDVLHLLNASPHVGRMTDLMQRARQLYYVGCGTSYHACVVGAVYAARIAGRAVPTSW